ncbi:MAG: helix-turn-helix domain-containing protein, partial [Myxococcota bacterium]
RFRHPAPRSAAAHRAFFGCAVVFEAEHNELVLPTAVVDRIAPVTANPAMAQYFDQRAAEQLRQLKGAQTFSARIQVALLRALASGEPTMGDLARQLGMAARTLRRRLHDEGVTFRELLDDVRRQRAEQLVGDPDYSVGDIAFLLGFSEPSAFSRAFKRWFGVTPRGYRQRGSTTPRQPASTKPRHPASTTPQHPASGVQES